MIISAKNNRQINRCRSVLVFTPFQRSNDSELIINQIRDEFETEIGFPQNDDEVDEDDERGS